MVGLLFSVCTLHSLRRAGRGVRNPAAVQYLAVGSTTGRPLVPVGQWIVSRYRGRHKGLSECARTELRVRGIICICEGSAEVSYELLYIYNTRCLHFIGTPIVVVYG